jgi:hypothetical protein
MSRTLRIRLDGEPPNVHAYLVSDTLERLADLPLDWAGIDGAFVSHVVVGTNPIRVLVTGRGDEGRLLQRLSPAPLTPR